MTEHSVKSKRRIAVVTGGASGIGLAIVRRLISSDMRVGFVTRDPDRLQDALAAIDRDESCLIGQSLDVTDEGAAGAFIDQLRGRWGAIDVLINNAGISPRRPDRTLPWSLQVSIDEWRQVLDVNLTGAFIFARLVAPGMVQQRFGRVVNISSLAGRTVPQIAGPHYSASKAGIVGLTRALSRDLAGHGITVNCVAPGRILTGMTEPLGSDTNRAAIARIPVGRIGTPEDIADTVAFLASDAASFITGATVDVNGGEFGN